MANNKKVAPDLVENKELTEVVKENTGLSEIEQLKQEIALLKQMAFDKKEEEEKKKIVDENRPIKGYIVTITPNVASLEDSLCYMITLQKGKKIGGVYKTNEPVEIPKECLDILKHNIQIYKNYTAKNLEEQEQKKFKVETYGDWKYVVHSTVYKE